MNIDQLIEARQSCRSFSEQPVPKDLLVAITEAGRLAPSACNSQPWFFHVVTDPLLLKKVASACETSIAKAIKINKFCALVPAFIIVTTTKPNLSERVGMKLTSRDFVSIDIGLCVSQMVLKATSLNLGTCILGAFDEKQVASIINTKQDVALVIAVGYAKDTTIRNKKRKNLKDITQFYD